MVWNFMPKWSSKKSSLKKVRFSRFLKMETLEKRELLSVAPVGVEEVDFLDGNGNLKYDGTLNYSVLENETANRGTCIVVNGVQLGGDGGVSSLLISVEEGSALPDFTPSAWAQAREAQGTIRLEDSTDNDYNDLVVKITFTPLTQAPIDSFACTPCSCTINNLTHEITIDDKNLSRPTNGCVSSFRFENAFPTSQKTRNDAETTPVRMTATLEMGTLSKTVHYDTTELDPSENFAVGMNLDTSSLATGRYAWTMNFVYEYADGTTLTLNSDGTFTVVDQGETFLFNAQGQLLTRTDNLTQEITTWSYNADGTAASKTEEGNRVKNYGYSNGKLQTVTDFAGRWKPNVYLKG